MKQRPQKEQLRLAIKIREEFVRRSRGARCTFDLPEVVWVRCQRLTRQLRHAQARGWYTSMQTLQRDMRTANEHLRHGLIERQPTWDVQPQAVTSLREIYDDLCALSSEFNEVKWDLREKSLEVITDPIELEGVQLGRFSICLNWHRRNPKIGYNVLALDPNPSARSYDVTHPHVQDETLCEGEGTQAIQSSLKSGRLYDFFTLVDRILHTYNSGSPYVAISDWSGRVCSDCDDTYDDDDFCTCQRCDGSVCCDCSYGCTACDDTFCSGCSVQCELCLDRCCLACSAHCSTCNRDVCKGCLSDQENTCDRCHEPETKPAEEPQEVAVS